MGGKQLNNPIIDKRDTASLADDRHGGREMEYKLITTRKDGRFGQSFSFATLAEAEAVGYNHTRLENMFGNYIPIKNERLFRVYEITPKFNIMEVI